MTHSYLVEYYEKIKSGRIIAGQELIMMLEILMEDMEDPQYIFDTKEAHWRIEFMGMFCRQTKSPYYGKPLELMLWQKAYLEALYGFYMADTGLRRFRKSILLVARKNGKTTLCSAIGLNELMLGPGGQDIVCSSNDDKQADLIFEEINNMREQFDPNGKRTHKNLQGIYNLKNKSKVYKLSDRTKNKEGRNIDIGFLDESHEMKDNVIAKSIEQSQSTKDEPMFINITTEGFVNDGYLDKELKYAREVINREREDPTILVWLYTQDSEAEVWQDKRMWAKSNPSLGVIKKYHYFDAQLRKAQADKAERAFTLAKDFNIKQNNSEAWLLEEEYTNEETFAEEDLHGCIAIGGVDLSETTDLTCAKAMVMKPGSNKKYFLTKYFIPESKVERGEAEDKKNYLEWARKRYVTICPGNENDFSLITQWYVSLYKQLGLKFFKIGYDNALAKFWVDEMTEIGFDMERVNQRKEAMSDPMKLVEADLRSKLLIYNNNPIDKWCLGNTAMKIDNLGMIMPVKVQDKRNRRIDGAVTKIICYSVYMRYRTDYLNIVR
jgi:phage terminase large subunit-like protein